MRAAQKVMPPISLCWPSKSEADVSRMAVEGEPSHQYSVPFCCRSTDGSRGTVWQNGIWQGSVYDAKISLAIQQVFWFNQAEQKIHKQKSESLRIRSVYSGPCSLSSILTSLYQHCIRSLVIRNEQILWYTGIWHLIMHIISVILG